MPKLLYVINIFRTAAVPNVLLDIYPYIRNAYEPTILSLEKIDENDRLVQQCREIGIPLESLNTHRLNLLLTALRLKRYLKEHQPDLIHSHLGRADILCALCKNREGRLITTFHNVRQGYSVLSQWGYLLTDRKANSRLSVSNTVELSWYSGRSLSSPHEVTYNCVHRKRLECSENRTAIRTRYGLSEQDILLLNIGRLTRQKGQMALVAAMKSLVDRDNRFKLLICGRGPLEQKMRSAIATAHLENAIILPGFIDNVAELLAIANIFITTPLFEGHSVAIIEAMATRTPIVCSYNMSFTEILKPGTDALYVQRDNQEQIAATVLELVGNPTLREQLANNAYSKYEEWFTPQTTASRYMQIYAELMRDR